MNAVNDAANNGHELVPGRSYDATPLTEPPYYVIEARPAVTYPFTGVRITPESRVLRPDGDPVPGLLAAGADTGGLYHRGRLVVRSR